MKIVGPASGRRLTSAELGHTLADLFGPSYAALAGDVEGGEPAYHGFRNDITVSTVDSGTVGGLRTVAGKVAAALPAAALERLGGCAAFTATCQAQFIRTVGRLLYRRPVETDDLTNLLPLFTVAADDPQPFQRGARLVLEAMLQSPRFLYRLETQKPLDGRTGLPQGPTPHELATRLSYLAWASTPGPALLDAADKGALASADAITAQLAALLADPRAQRGFRAFADEWLALYRNTTVRRPRADLGVTATVLAQMRDETLDFLQRLAFSRDTDLMSMFTDPRTTVTPELARIYGLQLAATKTIDVSTLPSRLGLITQPGFLGINAGEAQASIVDRAMVVRDHLLCLPPLSTPAGLDVVSIFEKTDPNLSERDRFAQHRTDARCVGCHEQIEPYGYAFEIFDLVGRINERDARGNPLRGDGEMYLDGKVHPYTNVRDMARLFASSPEVAACLADRFVRYAMGRAVERDEAIETAVRTAWKKGGRTYAALITAVVTSPAFRAAGPEMAR